MTNEPNVAEWITAWSAAAGVVVSFVLVGLTGAAARFARRAARASAELVTVERGRDDRQEKQDRRAQAEQVVAWIKGASARSAMRGQPIDLGQGTLFVRNASRTPVWDVRVQLTDATDDPMLLDQPAHVFAQAIIPPDDLVEVPIWESGHWRPEGAQLRGMLFSPNYLIDNMHAVLTFRDAANVTWTRPVNGVLEERSPRLDQKSGRTG